ncbi:hypothetical protein AgCh_002297 [Apium graveolens]
MHSSALRPVSSLGSFSRNLSSRKINLNPRSRHSNLLITSAYDKNQNGRVVNENMIVLRMRIRDIKMAESNEDQDVSENWMEWEKTYYRQKYSSDITKGVGMLQVMLMETRPSLVLGMLALVLFGLSYSMVVAVCMLIDMAQFVIHIIL